MSALTLKLLAVLCMTLDHIGILVPKLNWLRSIGRIAFPIYAFLLTEGFRHSRNRGRYALRLAVFALLSQIPFSLFNNPDLLRELGLARELLWELLHHGNVILTLFVAFLCLWLLETCRKKPLLLAAAVAVILGVCLLYYRNIIHSDYGAKCILLVLVFYYFKGRPVLMFFGMFVSVFHVTLLSLAKFVLLRLMGRHVGLRMPSEWTIRQLYSLLALIPIYAYNGEPGPRPGTKAGRTALKLLFYAYYPLHLLLLPLLFH